MNNSLNTFTDGYSNLKTHDEYDIIFFSYLIFITHLQFCRVKFMDSCIESYNFYLHFSVIMNKSIKVIGNSGYFFLYYLKGTIFFQARQSGRWIIFHNNSMAKEIFYVGLIKKMILLQEVGGYDSDYRKHNGFNLYYSAGITKNYWIKLIFLLLKTDSLQK